MRHTPNLLLKLPDSTDYVNIEDINENMVKIDEEIAKINNPESGVVAKLTTHLADMAKHNQFMYDGVLHQLGFGYNPTLGCMTFSIREVI
ncbi:MAG: hypothetical protein ABS944_16390 [Solibacillus sp.]|uniref:hypothetical protein n=1 Tax=Solibacillus sp. TaxID=1909654 RepID=UPI0033152911